MTRVYLPATPATLATHVAEGRVVGVEGVLPDGDGEVSEYAALMQAAQDAQALLDAGPSAGAGRRVVLVADVGDGDPDAPIPLRALVAVHADTAARPAGADPDDDLGWYAVQELDALLADALDGDI